MDRERLTELLQDPAQVANEDLGDLRSMTERFPWFSGAHLLLAVGEHARGDVLSSDPGRSPAAYLPSREVLFDLTQVDAAPARPPMHVVKGTRPEMPVVAALPSELPATLELPPSLIDGAPPAAPAAEQPSATRMQEEVLPPVIEGPIHFADDHRQIPMESPVGRTTGIAAQPPAPPTPAPLPKVADPLDSQIREAILSSGYDLRLIPTVQPDRPPEAAAVRPLASMPAPPPPSPTEAAERKPVQAATQITKASRLRFTDWLTASAVVVSPPPFTDTQVHPASGALAPSVNEVLADPSEIIERFIRQSVPASAPAKAEFFTPQQAAKRSLQDDGLVSETLAKIYERQGDVIKAKAAYARLAVLHPEKSVYFAALSKALEGRSNK